MKKRKNPLKYVARNKKIAEWRYEKGVKPDWKEFTYDYYTQFIVEGVVRASVEGMFDEIVEIRKPITVGSWTRKTRGELEEKALEGFRQSIRYDIGEMYDLDYDLIKEMDIDVLDVVEIIPYAVWKGI